MQLLPEFLIGIICKKLTYYEWKEAHDKWFKAIEKVNKKEKFNCDNGFNDLVVVRKCSYCRKVKNNCLRCPLFYRNICSLKQRESLKFILGKSFFWKFVKDMENTYYYSQRRLDENFDWSKPLAFSQKVLMAINKDKPLR